MIISDLNKTEGRAYPARRRTRNLVGGAAPIQASTFSLGYVVLEPNGGQVPWHNQEQEEVYFVLEGTGEMCLGEERQTVTTGQAVYIPSQVFHQLTNIGDTPIEDDLLLRPRGRRGPLAAGAGRAHCPKRAWTPRRCPKARSPSVPRNRNTPSKTTKHLCSRTPRRTKSASS